MAVVKTDALSIQIKNPSGDLIDIHPDVLSIAPNLEAQPVYQIIRNTAFSRTNKLSFEYKIRLKNDFKAWANDGTANDPRTKLVNDRGPILEVISITLSKSDIKWYSEDIDKVDIGTEQFNSYIESATVSILSSIRDAKDGAMFDAIDAGATDVDANGYAQLQANGTIAKAALPAGSLARVELSTDYKIFAGSAVAADGINLSNAIHKRVRALMRIGAKNSVEEAFALATYGLTKSGLVILVDELAVDVLSLVPNVLTSPRAYQDMFIDGELNMHKGVMMISCARIPEKRNFYVLTKGVRGAVGLAEQSTKDMLMSVKEHPIAPEDYWKLSARQMWKWQAVEPWFAFVSTPDAAL